MGDGSVVRFVRRILTDEKTERRSRIKKKKPAVGDVRRVDRPSLVLFATTVILGRAPSNRAPKCDGGKRPRIRMFPRNLPIALAAMEKIFRHAHRAPSVTREVVSGATLLQDFISSGGGKDVCGMCRRLSFPSRT